LNNELKIKPLLRYELTFSLYDVYDGCNNETTEVFTADQMIHDEKCLTFYRTGNIIRKYFQLPSKVIITPADEVA
jgi:hypothetical protein